MLFGEWEWQVEAIARLIEESDLTADPLSAVRSAVLGLAHNFDQERSIVMLRSQLVESSSGVQRCYRTTIQPAWEQAIAEAVALLIDVDLDRYPAPRTLAAAAVGALNAALATWVANNCADLLPQLTEQTFDVLNAQRVPQL